MLSLWDVHKWRFIKGGGRGVKTCFLRSPQKFDKISQFCVDVKTKLGDFVNFRGLLAKYKLYPKRKVHKPHVMKKKIRGGKGSKIVDFETALFMEGPLVFYTAHQPRPSWPSPHQFGLAGAEKIVTDCWHERLFVETSQRCSTTKF